ncbi:MAG: pteridine-dependent deoxygenase [Rhodanobacteraceae bacterium]
MHAEPEQGAKPAAPDIQYRNSDLYSLLEDRRVLAVLDFADEHAQADDPRIVPVHLAPWPAQTVREVWRVKEPVDSGETDGIRWARGGGWLLAAVVQAESGDDIGTAARDGYSALTGFLRQNPEYHVQRLWNYLDRINAGQGDEERYRRFCTGRLEGMNDFFADGFPAATAIGHAEDAGYLQIYCLASRARGTRIENPRQLSAWRYPRQYGPVAPSFARAMRLPAEDGLAISGTAAIQGHQSQHDGDLAAQLGETLTNLRSLVSAGRMDGDLGLHSPLKVYVRHHEHLAEVDAFLAEHLPQSPRLLLQADICRSELLVEIDGWHFC